MSTAAEPGQESGTRTRLLDAVIHLASTRGLDKVTYRSVAAEAGVAHRMVGFYFGTRDAMVSEALERAAQLDAEESNLGADTIEDFGRNFLDVVGGERNRGMLQIDYLLRAVRGGLPVERVTALYDFYISEVKRTLDAVGIDDEDRVTAAIILAAIDGVLLQHAIYRSDERTGRMLEGIRDLMRLMVRSTDHERADRPRDVSDDS